MPIPIGGGSFRNRKKITQKTNKMTKILARFEGELRAFPCLENLQMGGPINRDNPINTACYKEGSVAGWGGGSNLVHKLLTKKHPRCTLHHVGNYWVRIPF